MLTEIFGKVKEYKTNPTTDRNGLIGSGILLNAITKTLMNILTISNFFKDFNDFIVEFGSILLRNVEGDLTTMLAPQDQFTIENITNQASAAQSLYYYVTSITCVLERSTEANATVALNSLMTATDGVLDILSRVLFIPVSIQGEGLFYLDPKTKAQELINETKALILTSFAYLINYIIVRNSSKVKCNTLHFYQNMKNNAGKIVSSIYHTFKLPGATFEAISQIESLHECLVAGLVFISKTAVLPDFFDLYITVYKDIFNDLLLRNLIISQKEAEDFEQNEVEFVNYAFDTCFRQKSKTVKTYAMKIVEIFCSKLDGALSYLARIVIALIDSILSNASQDQMLENYPMIAPIRTSTFLQQNSQEKVLDTCMLILSTLSTLVADRKDIM